MKRSWLWVALLLSLGVNIGILATIGVARMRDSDRWEETRDRDRRPPPFARLADHLGLEGERRQQFLEIQQNLFEATVESRRQLEEIRAALRREVMAEAPDPVEVERLLEKSARVSGALDRAMIDSVLATRQILDPGQQQRYFRVMDRLRQSNRRFGPRQGRPLRRPPRDDPQ